MSGAAGAARRPAPPGRGPARRRPARAAAARRDDGHGHGPAAGQGPTTSAARCGDCSAGSGPRRRWSSLVVVLAVVSVTFAIIGPKILGEATNLIFEGAISAQLPAGRRRSEQVVAGLRAAGPGPARRHARVA